MSLLRFSFERGGSLLAKLNDKTPTTCPALLEIFPLESMLRHTRWCGREIYMPICTNNLPLKENQTCIVSKFDLAYWREWDVEETVTPQETLSLFYGAERLAFHGGILTVNVVGRVLWEYEDMLDTIGERIWSSGFEGVKVELIPE